MWERAGPGIMEMSTSPQVSTANANPGPHYGSVMYQVIPFITTTVYTLATSSIKFNTEPLSKVFSQLLRGVKRTCDGLKSRGHLPDHWSRPMLRCYRGWSPICEYLLVWGWSQCVLLCLSKVWVSGSLSWAGALTTGLWGGPGNTEQTLCQPPASQAVPSQGWHSPGSHGPRQQPQSPVATLPALASPQPCPVTHHTLQTQTQMWTSLAFQTIPSLLKAMSLFDSFGIMLQ